MSTDEKTTITVKKETLDYLMDLSDKFEADEPTTSDLYELKAVVRKLGI